MHRVYHRNSQHYDQYEVAFLFDLQRYIMSMPKEPKNSSPKFLDAHAQAVELPNIIHLALHLFRIFIAFLFSF